MLGQSFGTIANMRGKTAQPPPGDPVAGISQMVGDLLEKQKGRHEMDAQKAMAQLVAAISTRQRFQPPKPVQPMGGKDLLPMLGIGLLAKLLGAKDQDIAQGAQGFMQGRGEWAQGQNKYNEDVYRADVGNAEADRQSLMDVAKLQYNEATGERDRLQGFFDKNAERAWEKEKFGLTQKRSDREKAVAAYNSANLPGEKRKAAAWLRVIDPSSAPTPEQEASDIAFLQRRNLPDAMAQFQRLVKDELSQFGFVSEDRKDQFETMAQALADNYGVDRASLPDIPAESTLRKKRGEELTAQFTKTFALREKQYQHRLTQDALNYDLAKRRYQLAQQYAGANFNLSANRYLLQVEQAAGRLKGTVDSELPKVEAELEKEQQILAVLLKKGEAGTQNKPNGETQMGSDAWKKQEQKVRDLVNERDALRELSTVAGNDSGVDPEGESLRFDPTAGAQMGGAAIPNPGAAFPQKDPLSGPIGGGAPNTRTRTRTRTNKATPPKKGGVVYQGNVSGANVTMRKKS